MTPPSELKTASKTGKLLTTQSYLENIGSLYYRRSIRSLNLQTLLWMGPKMSKKWISLLVLLAAAACGDVENIPLVQPGTETGTITIVNNNSRPVAGLNMGLCESNGRPDRLAGGEIIATGQSRDFVVSAGCYKAIAELGTNSITSTFQGLPTANVAAGETVVVQVPR